MRPVVLALAALAAVASAAQVPPDAVVLSGADFTGADPVRSPDLLGFEPPEGWGLTCDPCPSREFESVEVAGPDSARVHIGFMALPDEWSGSGDMFAAFALSVVTRSVLSSGSRADSAGAVRVGPVVLETVGGRPWLSASSESGAGAVRVSVARSQGGAFFMASKQEVGKTWAEADRVLAAFESGHQPPPPEPKTSRVLLTQAGLAPADVAPVPGAVTFESPTSTFSLALPEGWRRGSDLGGGDIEVVAPDSRTSVRVEYGPASFEAGGEEFGPLVALHSVAKRVYDYAERADSTMRAQVEPFSLRTVGGRRWLTGAVSYTSASGEPVATAEVSYARVPTGYVLATAQWPAAGAREHADRVLRGFAVRPRSASCGGLEIGAGVRLAVPEGFVQAAAPPSGVTLLRTYDLKEYDWWEAKTEGDDGLRTDSVSFTARRLRPGEAALPLDSLATRAAKGVLRPGEQAPGWSGWRRIASPGADVVVANVEGERAIDTLGSVVVVRIGDRVVTGRARDGDGGRLGEGEVELLANRLAVCDAGG